MCPTISDPSQALMSYTRLFDGADPQLVVVLRDYVELRGDLRSGGWEGSCNVARTSSVLPRT